jgi:hypothetical protein
MTLGLLGICCLVEMVYFGNHRICNLYGDQSLIFLNPFLGKDTLLEKMENHPCSVCHSGRKHVHAVACTEASYHRNKNPIFNKTTYVNRRIITSRGIANSHSNELQRTCKTEITTTLSLN